jgi:DNA-binding CsgD family transcriptional regulator
MELWERSAALDRMDGLLADSANAGRVVLVAGEAGIGKTAFVAEFVRRAGAGARVLWGGCDHLETPRALGPLHDMARGVGGVLASRMRPEASQEEVFAAFLDELSGPRQRARPVLVVEDAHWADGATLDWLVFLGRRIHQLSALLVVTYRDDEVGSDHPLRRALAAVPADTVHRIRLDPLTPGCVAEHALSAGHDPAVVIRAAGGNPLLVTEILKSEGEDVPGAVQDLVLERLRRLSDPARDLAHLVAVVPTRAGARFLVGEEDHAELCLAAGVVVASGDGVAYRHEILRSAVERSLSPLRRQALHRRAFEILVADTDVDPGLLVHHARGAGDDAALLRYAPVAGARAARHGAHREAAGHYALAVALADRLPAEERADLLDAFAEECFISGRHLDALDARQRALPLHEQLGQPERVADELRWISRLSWWTGQVAEARDAALRAIEVLQKLPESAGLADAYGNQALVHLTTHELDEARMWGERARDVGARHGNRAAELQGANTLEAVRLTEGAPDAVERLLEIHLHAHRDGLLDQAARALANLAMVTGDEIARFADAEPFCDQAMAYAEQHDFWPVYDIVLASRSKLRLERGDWTGAVADARLALDRVGRRGAAAILPLVVLGRVAAARGEPGALELLDDAERAAAGVGDVPMVAPVADARAELFSWRGDRARAREEAERALEFAGGASGVPFIVGRLAWRRWRAGGPAVEFGAEPFRAMIEGRWADAAADWDRRGGRYLRADALAEGDEPAAAEALALLDGWGATVAAQDLRARLRERGFTRIPRGPRRSTAANAAGLTERQLEVLALVVEGLSNAEIAERLTLAPKTVDHHVSAVLGKLELSRRGQVAGAARRLGLIT